MPSSVEPQDLSLAALKSNLLTDYIEEVVGDASDARSICANMLSDD